MSNAKDNDKETKPIQEMKINENLISKIHSATEKVKEIAGSALSSIESAANQLAGDAERAGQMNKDSAARHFHPEKEIIGDAEQIEKSIGSSSSSFQQAMEHSHERQLGTAATTSLPVRSQQPVTVVKEGSQSQQPQRSKSPILSSIEKAIKESFLGAKESMENFGNFISGKSHSAVDEAAEKVKSGTDIAAESVKGNIESAEDLSRLGKEKVNEVGDSMKKGMEQAKEKTKEMAESVSQKGKEISHDVSQKGKEVKEGVEEKSSEMWQKTKDLAFDTKEKAKDMIQPSPSSSSEPKMTTTQATGKIAQSPGTIVWTAESPIVEKDLNEIIILSSTNDKNEESEDEIKLKPISVISSEKEKEKDKTEIHVPSLGEIWDKAKHALADSSGKFMADVTSTSSSSKHSQKSADEVAKEIYEKSLESETETAPSAQETADNTKLMVDKAKEMIDEASGQPLGLATNSKMAEAVEEERLERKATEAELREILEKKREGEI